MTDFNKLQNQVQALLAPARTPQRKQAPETRRMTAEQFATYADEQVAKAKGEAAAGHKELSKRRLEALHAEVTRLAKFEFKPSELPTVTIYKDPDQLETTEEERGITSGGNSEPTGGNNWMAKSNQLAKQLSEAIGELSNRPTDKNQEGGGKPGEEKPKEGDPKPGEGTPAGVPPSKEEEQKKAGEWPRDFCKSIRPSRRDKDPDYDWGPDASAG